MIDLTLYTKPDCHLCDEVRAELARLADRYPHQVHSVDISRDPGLMARYGLRIPVLAVAGREYGAPLSRAQLEQLLQQASQASRPDRA
jgi:glutaredoxin-like protein DUF836